MKFPSPRNIKLLIFRIIESTYTSYRHVTSNITKHYDVMSLDFCELDDAYDYCFNSQANIALLEFILSKICLFMHEIMFTQ